MDEPSSPATAIAPSAGGTPRTGKLTKSTDWPGLPWRRVHLSPDAKTIAAEETNGPLSLWDVATGKCLHTYEGYRWHGDYPFVFSPDSRSMVVANWKDMAGILHHIDIATGKRRTLGKHLAVMCLAVSPDNKRLYSGGSDSSVRCWDIAAAKEVWKVKQWTTRMALSLDGRTLAVEVANAPQHAIRFLDASTGRTRGADKLIAASTLLSLAYGPQSDALLVGACNRDDIAVKTAIWDLGIGKERFRLPAYRVRCSPDGKTLAGFQGRALQCWDLATGKPRYPDTARLGHTEAASAITYSPDGKLLASVGYDSTVRLWNVATSRLLHTFSVGASYYPAFVRFTPDGKQLIAGVEGATMRFWDVATGKETRLLLLRDAGRWIAPLKKLHLSLDGKTLSTMSSLQKDRTLLNRGCVRTIIRWDLEKGKPLSQPLQLHSNYHCDFSAEGRVFLADEKNIHEVPEADVRLAYPAGLYLALMSPELGLTFSPDGALAAAPLRIDVREGDQFTQLPRGIQVWELATGQAVVRLPAKDFAQLAFSPDSRTLVTVGPKDIQVWEIVTAKELYRQPVPGHLTNRYGCPLVFAPDGRTLATALEDTTIAIWDLSTIRREGTAKPPLTAKQQDVLWTDLAGKDAARAYAAIGELTARPEQTIALFRQRLRPVAHLPVESLQRAIADLDSAEFARREAASRSLAAMRPLADSALREALTKKPALEVRKRIESLLSERVVRALSAETLRGLRAVRVLEQIGSTEACEQLKSLACGVLMLAVPRRRSRPCNGYRKGVKGRSKVGTAK